MTVDDRWDGLGSQIHVNKKCEQVSVAFNDTIDLTFDATKLVEDLMIHWRE